MFEKIRLAQGVRRPKAADFPLRGYLFERSIKAFSIATLSSLNVNVSKRLLWYLITDFSRDVWFSTEIQSLYFRSVTMAAEWWTAVRLLILYLHRKWINHGGTSMGRCVAHAYEWAISILSFIPSLYHNHSFLRLFVSSISRRFSCSYDSHPSLEYITRERRENERKERG